MARLLLLSVLGASMLAVATSHSWWEGTWTLQVGKGGYDRTINCGGRYLDSVAKEFRVTLQCPDRAVDEFGNEGYWTSVLEWGVEIVIQGRKFYTFPWKRHMMNNVSNDLSWYFGMTLGWSHDVLGNNWACFQGRRYWKEGEDKPKEEETLHFKKYIEGLPAEKGHLMFQTDHDLITRINQEQSFWVAERYPEFENLTNEHIVNLAGGKYSYLMDFPANTKVNNAPKSDPAKNETNGFYLPAEFDWRNFGGRNYVGPVRNQGRCGSCYAFAATAMQESRVRILSKNQLQPTYSPQDMVDCSPYAFGCGGGILFSEAKFGEDYGYAEEACNTYRGWEQRCQSLSCKRSYSTDYEMIGTHWGGCNELLMRLAIYYHGPIVVGYRVYSDFLYYKTGIYYHYGPNYALGGHAVTVVGWGYDYQTGTKYWIAKNSWGSTWGEQGFFRIIRGVNECGFESMAWQATPLL